jgi:hypothetical protein
MSWRVYVTFKIRNPALKNRLGKAFFSFRIKRIVLFLSTNRRFVTSITEDHMNFRAFLLSGSFLFFPFIPALADETISSTTSSVETVAPSEKTDAPPQVLEKTESAAGVADESADIPAEPVSVAPVALASQTECDSIPAEKPLAAFYTSVPLALKKEGRSLTADAKGAGAISVNGKTYRLERMEWEKTVGGVGVVRLHHKSRDGEEAVLFVPLKTGDAKNADFEMLLQSSEMATLSPGAIIPSSPAYKIIGCNAAVLQIQMEEAVVISEDQSQRFAALFAAATP